MFFFTAKYLWVFMSIYGTDITSIILCKNDDFLSFYVRLSRCWKLDLSLSPIIFCFSNIEQYISLYIYCLAVACFSVKLISATNKWPILPSCSTFSSKKLFQISIFCSFIQLVCSGFVIASLYWLLSSSLRILI